MKLSEKIIKLRKEKGLSQEEFGDKINVSRQAISKWESEQSQPEVEKIKEISKVFSVSIEYLLNDELENDNTKKIIKFNKKKFGKCLLKVIIVLIIIYLIYSAYKYIILYNYYKNILEISDDEICEGTYKSYNEDKITKDLLRYNVSFISGEEIYLANHYTEFSTNTAQQDNLTLRTIYYINEKNNVKFYLQYDSEKQKYVYNEQYSYESLSNIELPYFTRKSLYMETGMLEGTILQASLNPTIIVTNKYIKSLYANGYAIIEFNNRGDITEGASKFYKFTDQEELTVSLDLNESYDYNVIYLNENEEFIAYDIRNIKSVEELADFYGIEVIIEE